eukprot:GILK01004789.1.p1 GENE.GILK01004789.1~~GILK01004789.1.p1  ORF type:complete len:519 (+),score=77.49 GILK01004789.1:30-1586(+)
MESLQVRSLRRWVDTAPLCASPAASEHTAQDELHPNSKFPVNDEVNRQLILWQGDVTKLEVDALMNSTNPDFSGLVGMSAAVLSKAGPEMEAECASLEACRTGEVRITKGYRLPARFVIHTVEPTYNMKYKIAAENALHSCYRSALELLKEQKLSTIALCPVAEHKGFPRLQAAHITARTIRRFLERHGGGIQAVVLCVGTALELELYQTVLALYFPRTPSEQTHADTALPKDTGNLVGESEVEDRKIRLSIPTRGTDDEPSHEPGSVSGSVSVEGCERDGFSAMKADPDLERIQRNQSSSNTLWSLWPKTVNFFSTVRKVQSSQSDPETVYERLLQSARREPLSDIAALQLIDVTSRDSLQRPVVVVSAAELNQVKVDLDRFLLYLVLQLDGVVEQDYVVLYIHGPLLSSNRPDLLWIKRVYNLFNRKYKKNLKALYIVRPNFWLKTVMLMLRPFLSTKFWRKVTYLEQLDDVWMHFDKQQLRLPDSAYRGETKAKPSKKSQASSQRSSARDSHSDL